MKKVVFFSHSQALGGAELSMLDIMARIDRRGFEPALLAPGEGPLKSRARGFGVKILDAHIPPRLLGWQRGPFVRGLPVLPAVDSVARLAALLRSEKPDALYTHSQKAHVLGGLAGRLAGVPVVWHAREILSQPALRQAMAALSRLLPSRIVCVSRAVSRQFGRGAGDRVAIVPNGIDAALVRRQAAAIPRQAVRRRLGLPPGAPLAGMVSRIAPGKGQNVFIEAAGKILESLPDARFLIVGGALFGEEAYWESLRSGISRGRNAERIFFTGQLDRALPAMNALDVMVHCPIVPEGFGRAVAEAMALGVPVVSARGGGIPELIDDGVNGLLVEPGDAGGLSRAVIRLLSDPALRRKLAGAAMGKIESCCRMETAVASIENALKSV